MKNPNNSNKSLESQNFVGGPDQIRVRVIFRVLILVEMASAEAT